MTGQQHVLKPEGAVCYGSAGKVTPCKRPRKRQCTGRGRRIFTASCGVYVRTNLPRGNSSCLTNTPASSKVLRRRSSRFLSSSSPSPSKIGSSSWQSCRHGSSPRLKRCSRSRTTIRRSSRGSPSSTGLGNGRNARYRVCEEIERHADFVGLVPNPEALLRLPGANLVEQHVR